MTRVPRPSPERWTDEAAQRSVRLALIDDLTKQFRQVHAIHLENWHAHRVICEGCAEFDWWIVGGPGCIVGNLICRWLYDAHKQLEDLTTERAWLDPQPPAQPSADQPTLL